MLKAVDDLKRHKMRAAVSAEALARERLRKKARRGVLRVRLLTAKELPPFAANTNACIELALRYKAESLPKTVHYSDYFGTARSPIFYRSYKMVVTNANLQMLHLRVQAPTAHLARLRVKYRNKMEAHAPEQTQLQNLRIGDPVAGEEAQGLVASLQIVPPSPRSYRSPRSPRSPREEKMFSFDIDSKDGREIIYAKQQLAKVESQILTLGELKCAISEVRKRPGGLWRVSLPFRLVRATSGTDEHQIDAESAPGSAGSVQLEMQLLPSPDEVFLDWAEEQAKKEKRLADQARAVAEKKARLVKHLAMTWLRITRDEKQKRAERARWRQTRFWAEDERPVEARNYESLPVEDRIRLRVQASAANGDPIRVSYR